MNMILVGVRASLMNASTILALLLFIAATTVVATKQRLDDDNTCLQTTPLTTLPKCSLEGQRFELEHSQLLKRLERGWGKWDKHHPRWALLDALYAYDNYEEITGDEIKRFENLYKHVPAKHKKILESTISYNKNFAAARAAIKVNANLCRAIFEHGLSFYRITREEVSTFAKENPPSNKKNVHRSQVAQALKHLVRDWSSEGHAERIASFPYILSHLPESNGSILVPGAGVGSLAHEIGHMSPDVRVTSNEFSAYMNLAYRYMASFTTTSYQPITIHPFIDLWSHARTRYELFRPVRLDSSPSLIGASNTMLVEGDFTKLFHHQQGEFDAVATLFFIDTARNIVDYIEKIYEALRPGGKWVNVGPLLYGSAPFVQLSLDEVVSVAEAIGFVFERRSEGEVMYNFNQSTLYKHAYNAQFWVARKPEGAERRKGWW